MRAVFRKELHRIFSDIKLIFTTFLLGPIIMIVILGVVMAISFFSQSSIEKNIPSLLINNSPQFVNDAAKEDSRFKFDFVDGLTEEQLVERYKADNINLVVSFPKEFEKTVDNYDGSLPVVKLIYDRTNDFSEKAYTRFNKSIMDVFKQKVLVRKIGDENALKVFTLEDISMNHNIYDEKKVGGQIISKFLPYLLFISIFGSAMGLVIESIAGEKERGTLATQLLTPIKRQDLAYGKLFGLSVMSVTSMMVTIASIIITAFVVLKFLPPYMVENLKNSISYGAKDTLMILAILIPTVLMNTSMIMTLSALGKNIKEANGYVMPLYLITIVVSTIPMNAASGSVTPIWQYCIPIYGQVIGLTEVFRFTASPLGIGLASLIPLIITGIMIFIIRNIFENERMIVS